jgi:hypothetical protein
MFADGFEKIALNAVKMRELAKKHGVLADHNTNWKWAVRNLRKGKTPERLGSAPKGLIDAVRREGRDTVEAGARWGKGAKGSLGQVGKGTESGFNFVDVNRFKKEVMPSIMRAQGEPAKGTSKMKAVGEINRDYKKFNKQTAHLNTIHSHPSSSTKDGLPQEKDYANMMRGMPKLIEENPDHFKHLSGRQKKIMRRTTETMTSSVDKRHSSIRPEIMPSGYALKNPYNQQGSDVHHFLHQNVGTHHNVVSGKEGGGMSVSTVRPDKKSGGKRLRTVVFGDR